MDEENLVGDLLQKSSTQDTDSNRKLIADAFRQGWVNGTSHQRWAETAALGDPDRASALVSALDLMELDSDRRADI
jgi:hypothetical protein